MMNKQPGGGTCDISGLKPKMDYNCEVYTIYNKTNTYKETNVKVKTKPGSK